MDCRTTKRLLRLKWDSHCAAVSKVLSQLCVARKSADKANSLQERIVLQCQRCEA